MKNMLNRFFDERGIRVFGYCALSSELKGETALSGDILDLLKSAIVFGFPLAAGVLGNIEGGPDLLYLHHYRQVNFALDRAARELSSLLEENGFISLPVAASQIVDWASQRAHVSHKRLACECGLGWMGRNNLFVHPVYGSRLRLCTVLTCAELAPEGPKMSFSCGNCRACVAACPASAIFETPQEFDHMRCFEKIKEITRERKIGQYICGLCVKACVGARRPGSQSGGIAHVQS